MNKRQTEVEKAKLAAEENELKHLKAIYNKAASDISKKISISNGKINVLLADFDDLDEVQKSILQSQIYQRDFQKSLQKQIDGFMKGLNEKQYESVDEYLKDCYTNGYIGTMYDIAGQGIPLVIPIDQKQVAKAMTHNTKLSKKLYTRLGEDVDLLKKRVANNISRGIATADSYANIARNIANGTNVSINRTMTIARTEGHRIQVQATNDAQHDAKDKGADVVKQWDSTLDGKTRPHHRQLDGQIRELDDPFEVDGMKVMYPSDFGKPGEDINCRCALLQRARWALGEEELETLKERAAYFGLDKAKDFEDYKKKYLKAAESYKKDDKIEMKNEYSEAYKSLRDGLEKEKVKHIEVKMLESELDDNEIIKRVSGADKTDGSCASLGFAYIGNKHGFDVLDFRGGNSQEFFSLNSNIIKMMELNNVKGIITKVKKESSDTAKIIKGLEHGKEYYLSVGRHAAIIRNTENGAEYLELQSGKENGWMPFDRYGSTEETLRKRFGCRKTAVKIKYTTKVIEKTVVLIDVDSFSGNEEFKDILGYINTAVNEQKKGDGGGIK